MNRDSAYFKRASLMLRMIPYVAQEKCFALKGGTAINFFLRNMPRLSVDIDLTYLPLEPRDTSLLKIAEALQRIAATIRKAGFRIQEGRASSGRVTKLFVSDSESRITIEPNEVIRGSVHPPTPCDTSELVEKTFETSAEIQTLAAADIYGGKLCAALDRQHPRDLFDVKVLLDHEGITETIRRTFVVYLASHDRPIHELIDPTRKNIREIFDHEFVGMTIQPVSLDELTATRETYINLLKSKMTSEEKQFLLTLKEGHPRWDLLALPGIENLPAIQWKLVNIKKMEKKKHAIYLRKLREILEI